MMDRPVSEKSEKSDQLDETATLKKDHSDSDTDQILGPTTEPSAEHNTLCEADEKADSIDHSNVPSEDEFEVYWNGPSDPEHPYNWSRSRKVSIISLVSFVSFLTPLASSMFAPGIPDVMSEFNTSSNILATFVVSIYILGFAFGPLIIAPTCEMMGRTVVYHACNILFVIFTVANALSTSTGMLIAFRFLAGFAGVGATTIGSGTIADMIPKQRRGLYMSLWATGPILGPVVGPIAGGFLIQDAGWRWVFWTIAITGGVVTVVCWFVLRETFEPVLLERKAAKLRKETGNLAWYARSASSLTTKQLWAQSIVRPMKILLFSPVASLMCVYIAILYGLLYILFTTFTFVYKDQYGWPTSTVGLGFLGSGVGTLAGLSYSGLLSDRLIRIKIAKNQEPQPEDRLPLYIVWPGSLSIPIGLFIYGWGAHFRVQWILPQIGTAFTGFGMILILFCIQTYLVDAYGTHAASAIAANTVLRSLLGALLPLCGLEVYKSLGLGWGNSLLGFVSLGIAPIPVLFMLFGERLRNRHMRLEHTE